VSVLSRHAEKRDPDLAAAVGGAHGPTSFTCPWGCGTFTSFNLAGFSVNLMSDVSSRDGEARPGTGHTAVPADRLARQDVDRSPELPDEPITPMRCHLTI